MSDFLFDELKPILDYYPIQYGNAKIVSSSDIPANFRLTVNDLQWCVLRNDNREMRQLFLELNRSSGDVVTTGLGFGIVQSYLLTKKDITSLTVFEKSLDVIEIFKETCKMNDFDITRLNIINDDANNMKNITCDWLIMDHFEGIHQPAWEIIDSVRTITSNNNAKNVWFWSIIKTYDNFCKMKQLNINVESFNIFVNVLNIKKIYIVSNEEIEYIKKVILES